MDYRPVGPGRRARRVRRAALGRTPGPRVALGRGYLVPQLLQPGVLQALIVRAVVDEVVAHDPRVLPAVQAILGQDD